MTNRTEIDGACRRARSAFSRWLARVGRPAALAGILWAAAGCSLAELRAAPTPFPRPTQIVAASTAAASPTATLPPTPSVTPTPDPYAGLTILDLVSRTYGGGGLTVEETMGSNSRFTRYLFSYPSDGLEVYGFMDVPIGAGPFPVALVLHGYIDPQVYNTLTYTTGYADALARDGYLVLHPNYRNYPPSEEGPNLFRVGYAVDVMNLIAIVREQGGQPGPLERARPDSIGLLGHSMGGGIALRTITVTADIRAAVLYGSMSGDEQQNFRKIFEWSEGQRGWHELNTAEGDLLRISPIYFLERIQSPVSIHHGEADDVVPPEWSHDLCDRLTSLGKPVECFFYAGQPHTFRGEGELLFLQRVAAFFDAHLK
jgi:dienelactone hydrolase